MIKSFKSKSLEQLYESGQSARIDSRLAARILIRLDRLNAVDMPDKMNLPGFDFHALRGKPLRYSVHVNGPWCITFEFADGDAYRIDLVQYH